MKPSKDPFEAAFNEQGESPPDSPVAPDATEDAQTHPGPVADNGPDDDYDYDYESDNLNSAKLPASKDVSKAAGANASASKAKEDEEEEEEDNMDVELGKLAPNSDPDKMAKMQSILSQFTEEQMNRYESFRRSGFQKSNMKKLLASITGSQKIPSPIQIVVCGIAKMFVGELVEAARIVMTERNESGPIRPCHMREAYRRLKLEGKIPQKSTQRLFK
uniref:TAFII28-like protein domain-containing protein n=1 Tax=Kalanchoe fedtschenkoi TaxID=63787 RepID=A0A7N0UUQ2_KALFE